MFLAFLGLGIILGLIISEGFRAIILGLLMLGIGYGLFVLLIFLIVRFSSFFQSLFRYLLTILSILFILWVLYSIGNGIKNWKPREKISERTERIQQETESQINPILLEEENKEQKISDSLEVQLKWVSFDQEIYKGSYRAHKQDIFDSKAAHNRLKYARIQEIGEVYSYAYVNDQDKLTSLYRMLDQIRSQNNLGELEFAELVVSMVQSLEYTLIVDENCDALSLTGNREIRRLLKDFSCESPHAFGLKTPLEFLTTLKGDCDTRTVALYTILKHFGYDVAIMNSDVYQHSMLGIQLPGVRGKFKVEQGRKYLFWETTSPQSPIGFLPPDFGVINNWYIVLN
jgi:biopolymer transport protein ExbB/TolQ